MKAPGTHYKWVLLAMLFIAAALNYGDRTAITSVFPLLRKELGMSDVALGATSTFFLWSYAAVSPLAGFFGDRFSRSKVLAGSLGAWSVVMAASSFARTAGQLLALRGALGVVEAAYIPVSTALIADHHGPDTRAKAIGIHIAGFSFGMIAGGWFSGYIGDHAGWRPSFLTLGCLGLILTLICRLFLKDKEREPSAAPVEVPSFLGTLGTLVRIPTFLILTLENVLSGTVNWVFISWLPLFFRETFSLSLAMAGLYGTLWVQGGRVLGVVAGGVPSDMAARRHPKYRMLMMSVCYLTAAPILLTFAYSAKFGIIATAIFVYNVLAGMAYVNSQPLLCELLPERSRASAIGLMNMSSCFVGGAGVLLAGFLKRDVGLAKSFASLTFLEGFVAVMLAVTFFTPLPGDLARAKSRQPVEVPAG